jgi:Fe-S-cluster containining protein
LVKISAEKTSKKHYNLKKNYGECMMVDTFYLHLEFAGTFSGWSVNLPFLCSKCGVCCTLDDFLTAGEITFKLQEQPEVRTKLKDLFETLGVIFEEDEAKYDLYITHHSCPFLIEKSCSIYEIRPEGCRQYPNTKFGMQTQDCEALNRFKRQRTALRKGRKTKETYHFTSKNQDIINPAKLTEKQYQNCLKKLYKARITDEELALFKIFNLQKSPVSSV